MGFAISGSSRVRTYYQKVLEQVPTPVTTLEQCLVSKRIRALFTRYALGPKVSIKFDPK